MSVIKKLRASLVFIMLKFYFDSFKTDEFAKKVVTASKKLIMFSAHAQKAMLSLETIISSRKMDNFDKCM